MIDAEIQQTRHSRGCPISRVRCEKWGLGKVCSSRCSLRTKFCATLEERRFSAALGVQDRRASALLKLLLLLWLQLQRGGVHAVTQPRRTRTIRKDVPQMRLAARTPDFSPTHAVRSIRKLFDRALSRWLIEAGPAGSGVEFCFGAEERLSAAHAGIRSRVFGLIVFPGERRLSSTFARYLVLFRRQFFLPLGFGFSNFLSHRSALSY